MNVSTFSIFLVAILALACISSSAQVKTPVVEIPFEFYRNEIILQVKVNGKGPFNMMLDTGTDPSGIDLATAKEIGLKLTPLGKPATGGGTDVNLVYGTELSLVEVGGLTAKNLEAVAINLSKVSDRLGKQVVGNLDTGSNGGFALTPEAVSFLGLEEEVSRAKVATNVGYNGVSENREGKVGNVSVGGISVDAPAATFFGKGMGHDKKPWGINIGNVFLKDFVLTIDYRKKLVMLEMP